MKGLKIGDKIMDTRNYRVGKIIEKKKVGWYVVDFRDKKHLGDRGDGIE